MINDEEDDPLKTDNSNHKRDDSLSFVPPRGIPGVIFINTDQTNDLSKSNFQMRVVDYNFGQSIGIEVSEITPITDESERPNLDSDNKDDSLDLNSASLGQDSDPLALPDQNSTKQTESTDVNDVDPLKIDDEVLTSKQNHKIRPIAGMTIPQNTRVQLPKTPPGVHIDIKDLEEVKKMVKDANYTRTIFKSLSYAATALFATSNLTAAGSLVAAGAITLSPYLYISIGGYALGVGFSYAAIKSNGQAMIDDKTIKEIQQKLKSLEEQIRKDKETVMDYLTFPYSDEKLPHNVVKEVVVKEDGSLEMVLNEEEYRKLMSYENKNNYYSDKFFDPTICKVSYTLEQYGKMIVKAKAKLEAIIKSQKKEKEAQLRAAQGKSGGHIPLATFDSDGKTVIPDSVSQPITPGKKSNLR